MCSNKETCTEQASSFPKATPEKEPPQQELYKDECEIETVQRTSATAATAGRAAGYRASGDGKNGHVNGYIVEEPESPELAAKVRWERGSRLD